MFVYENGNSLNLTFKGILPVENPEVVIKGYKDGAILTVNGTNRYGSGSEEFEGKAKTFVFQKDGKLMITFRGIEGIDNPEVTLDETAKGVVDVVIETVASRTSVTLTYDEAGVNAGEPTTESKSVEKEVSAEDNTAEPENTEVLTEEEPEELEEVEAE